ncbi:MAG: pentapeptide repeat-containing protein [candidate division KSB1 bacterium]|nr:pentapeptide repeat-containing protein [candidate division KSB1 bacterium]MDZ7336701.1 pentapeptide repeat-containing protein [candidate division KSB1 bacterium]
MSHTLLDSQDAKAMLLRGEPLQHFIIPSLDISRQTFDQNITIIDCIIDQFDASHCIFRGKVDCTKTQFGKRSAQHSESNLSNATPVGEDIKFCHSFFDQDAIFDCCEFYFPADFSQVNFSHGAQFNGTQFHQEVNFFAATLENLPSFEAARFHQEANFSSVHFGQEAIFRSSTFFDQSDFINAQFQNAEFENATFRNQANFENANFNGWADFSEGNFAGEANFIYANFENGADFSNAKFEHTAKFEKANFKEDCYFNETEFQSLADFDTAVFHKGADFRRCHFLDHAEFRSAQINDGCFADLLCEKPINLAKISATKIDFQGAQFRNDVTFSDSTVQQSANFSGARCEKLVCFDHAALTKSSFTQVQFSDHCSFQEAKFAVDAKFHNATFNTADFSRAVFLGPVHFDETKFSHTVLFRHAKFDQGEICFKCVTFLERADFTGAEFNDVICLQDVIAESIVITWEQVAGKMVTHRLKKYDEATRVYGLLKNIFERQNRYEDMDQAYRLFKRMERKARAKRGGHIWEQIKRFFNFLILDLGSGYGTRPMNIAITTLIIILLFGGIYYLGSDQIMVAGNPLSLSSPIERLVFCLYFSAVSFVTLGAENLSPNYYSWLKYVVTFQAFLGFFLMTLFVATFTRKVIR